MTDIAGRYVYFVGNEATLWSIFLTVKKGKKLHIVITVGR